MPARFIVLASGSSGNAAVVDTGSTRLLLDCGLRPPDLTYRLQQVGLTPGAITAVFLTHTHGDHWNRDTFALWRTLNVPVFAHAKHHDHLSRHACHGPLRAAGLAREFAESEPLDVAARLRVVPVRVPHDADPTFGFRVMGTELSTGVEWGLGYTSDCGHPDPAVAAAFAGVNVLAVEFNHDVGLQRSSGRHPVLVNRVLGPNGHMSNGQAADLTATVASVDPASFCAVVQLHLSRDCNTTALARGAATASLAPVAPHASIVTATQFAPAPAVLLVGGAPRRSVQPALPGFD